MDFLLEGLSKQLLPLPDSHCHANWNKLHHQLQTSTFTVKFTFSQQPLANSNHLCLDQTGKAQPSHTACCLHHKLVCRCWLTTVYGLSLNCFSCEALRSDFSIWNSFTVLGVKNGCLMWNGRPHCWGKHVFKLTPITEHGIWVLHICTLRCFASDPFVHPCLWVAKRGVLVPSSQDVWLHTGNTNTSAVVIFLVVILFF